MRVVDAAHHLHVDEVRIHLGTKEAQKEKRRRRRRRRRRKKKKKKVEAAHSSTRACRRNTSTCT
jgi:hypothetical protein